MTACGIACVGCNGGALFEYVLAIVVGNGHHLKSRGVGSIDVSIATPTFFDKGSLV